jgi:adenylate cyclase
MLIPVEEIFEDIATQSLCYLDIENADRPEFRVPLTDKDLVIGRDKGCEVCLPLSGVSSRHSRLTCVGEEYFIEDLGSTNGTYVNGIRIKKCSLYSNDQIRIGQARVHFIQHKIRKET